MRSSELWLKRIRNYAGFLGMILPWISLLGAALYDCAVGVPTGFWKNLSISETYYTNPALVGILTTASVVLMCYDGYDKVDNVVTTISGVLGIMIVVFPCNCPMAHTLQRVGFFELPVEISAWIHNLSACLFFILLAFNSLFLFTQGNSNTKQKKMRNKVYVSCGIGMMLSMLLMIVPINFVAKTFVVEALALTFFGVSWLIKGGALGILADK